MSLYQNRQSSGAGHDEREKRERSWNCSFSYFEKRKLEVYNLFQDNNYFQLQTSKYYILYLIFWFCILPFVFVLLKFVYFLFLYFVFVLQSRLIHWPNRGPLSTQSWSTQQRSSLNEDRVQKSRLKYLDVKISKTGFIISYLWHFFTEMGKMYWWNTDFARTVTYWLHNLFGRILFLIEAVNWIWCSYEHNKSDFFAALWPTTDPISPPKDCTVSLSMMIKMMNLLDFVILVSY